MKSITAILLLVLLQTFSFAQSADSLKTIDLNTRPVSGKPSVCQFNVKSIIIPAAMIGYGIVSLNNNSLKTLNISTKNELQEDHPRFKTHVDDFLQYSPAAAVYALNALGIKGAHNFKDRTFIYAISTLINAGVTTTMKHMVTDMRPDSSSTNSFPSGHSATAFAAAEFMRMEYKDVSPLYGIMGYAAATATGILRMYNNKHWLADVVTGAGVGILSTKIAYWVYPVLQRKFGKKNKSLNSMVMPYYQDKTAGIAYVYHFR